MSAMSVRTKCLGYRGESKSWPYRTRKQGSVLTNQCLGKERMLSEELPDGQQHTYIYIFFLKI